MLQASLVKRRFPAQRKLHFPGCIEAGPCFGQDPRPARRSVACSGARGLARGQGQRPGMSYRVVPLGRAWMCLAVPGQDRRGWGPELVVLGSGARDSPRLAEVSAPSRPGRPVCQSPGRRQRP